MPQTRAELKKTLRDTFAAAALTGLCANPKNWAAATFHGLAEQAYRQADEMLKAREPNKAEPTHALELYTALKNAVARAEDAKGDCGGYPIDMNECRAALARFWHHASAAAKTRGETV